MLRAGSEEQWGYSPRRLFSELPPRSCYEMARRVGIAPTSSGFGGPCIACLPPPCLENLRSTIQGHRDGHTTTHSPQSQATDRLLNKSCGAFWGGASVSALLTGLALSLSIAPAPAAAHPLSPRSQTASTAFVQQPACRPLCPWMADRPHDEGRSANKERTPLPRAGWSGDHSIAGVVPTGVSRWMFRCLWHTSQGSRLVL